MWRALFFAIGIMLVVAGLECLVVGQFTIAKEARIPGFLTRILDDEGSSPTPNPGQLSPNPNIAISPNVAPPQFVDSGQSQGYGGRPTSGSRFGPSRFDQQFGNEQFFGGQKPQNPFSNKAANSNQQFNLAGYGGANQSPIQSPPNPALRNVRIVRTKDWMPWSMVAAGVIIILYTKSSGHGDYGGD